MADKSELEKAVKRLNISRSETVYGLSDGHIYIDGNADDILSKAISEKLDIFTFKGKEIAKPQTITTKEDVI